MKARLAALILLGAPACGPAPAPVPPPPATASAPPPATASAAPPAPPAPIRDEGPPPDPPVALRWTFRLPSVAGRPSTTQRLDLTEDGSASWDAVSEGGDPEIGETLEPLPNQPSATPPEHCRGHVGPILHRRIVEALRKAMAAGCAPKAKSPRVVDTATTTAAVTWQGEAKSCDLARSGGSYALFDQARTEVVALLCRAR